jgi:hypothetical protein
MPQLLTTSLNKLQINQFQQRKNIKWGTDIYYPPRYATTKYSSFTAEERVNVYIVQNS